MKWCLRTFGSLLHSSHVRTPNRFIDQQFQLRYEEKLEQTTKQKTALQSSFDYRNVRYEVFWQLLTSQNKIDFVDPFERCMSNVGQSFTPLTGSFNRRRLSSLIIMPHNVVQYVVIQYEVELHNGWEDLETAGKCQGVEEKKKVKRKIKIIRI